MMKSDGRFFLKDRGLAYETGGRFTRSFLNHSPGDLSLNIPRVNRAHSFAPERYNTPERKFMNKLTMFARSGPSSTRLVMTPLNFPHAVNNL